MRKGIYSIITSIVLLLASIASAQSLWHGTEYGMTIEQVKSVVPNAVSPYWSEHLGDGSAELLRFDNVILVNKKFSASFYFNVGKLTQVTLSLQERGDFDSAMRVFNSLAEALRAKYGSEISNRIEKGTMNTADATWLSGRTNINLFAIGVGENDNDVILNINYQVRISSEADKL